ncbi:unnamed protein product [Bursaphelenchus xylophilus]|uniref:(pine wood nematode) hypothetical protein n=1 Tax=Bursaphelenchus xylophilus TaxID=6326 RepID=A0A1I7S4M3_BURXY|nr:unnamed protein product [Bursaphelenchus xylophilus]CAG9117235.1 unnamed protein product [Bursaphelenchus xylophilus]
MNETGVLARQVKFFDALRHNQEIPIGCAAQLMMPLTVGTTDYYVQHYVFPVQFILGVAGNCINLIVLLSAGMKNQANTLLSAMAFADLAFLVCLLPFSLASFPLFYSSTWFAYLFLRYKTHAVAFANMFSVAASWMVLAVSIERFTGVRRPMHTRFQLRDRLLFTLISIVFLFAFALTFSHHIEYDVSIISTKCNTIKAVYRHSTQRSGTSKFYIAYIGYAKIFQTLLGVALPVIAVAILNVSLIYFLRKREILPRLVTDKQVESRFVRYSDAGTVQRQERRVTATVLAIVTCFTVTHLPTLGPFLWEHLNQNGVTMDNNVITLLNTLLVSGKVLNFVLFCLSSTHFRQRTMVILSSHLCQESGRKKYSSMTTNTSMPKISNAGSQHHSIHLHDSMDQSICGSPARTGRRVQLQIGDVNTTSFNENTRKAGLSNDFTRSKRASTSSK